MPLPGEASVSPFTRVGPDEVSQERELLGPNDLQMGKKKDLRGVHMFSLRHGTCALTHRFILGVIKKINRKRLVKCLTVSPVEGTEAMFSHTA